MLMSLSGSIDLRLFKSGRATAPFSSLNMQADFCWYCRSKLKLSICKNGVLMYLRQARNYS